jgi:hypothetical protein
MNTTVIDLLRHLSTEQRDRLREVCVEIDRQLGSIKSEYDRERLKVLYRRRKEIFEGREAG